MFQDEYTKLSLDLNWTRSTNSVDLGTMRSRNSFGSVIGVCWKLVLGHRHDVARGGANNWGGQEGGEKGHAFDHACSGGMPLWWSCGC